ncbi:MAG: hypothetical protein ACE5G3_10185 [Gammaproteobacteria bacterium]
MNDKNLRFISKTAAAAAILAATAFLNVASAQLLGVVPGYPLFTYDNTGVTAFNATSGSFNVDADPLDLTLSVGGLPAFVVAPRSVAVRAVAGGAGCAVSGGNPGGGFDLEVVGDVFDSNFVLIKSGVLLTGAIVAMGSEATTATTSSFDFRCTNAGGLLVIDGDWPLGADIGMTLSAENSNFTGGCLTDFTAGAKGTIGPIEPPPPADVCALNLAKNAYPNVLTPGAGGSGGSDHSHKGWGDTDTDSDSGWDWDGSGDTDDSDGDSGSDSADSDMGGSASCGCKDRVTELTVRYNLPTGNLVEVTNGDGDVLFGPQALQPGQEFTFAVNGKKLKFFVNMEKVAMLKAGCKNPIGAGQTIGDGSELVVVTGKSKFRDLRPLCVAPGTTCGVGNQVTYTYDIINNGTPVSDVVLFDDQLGVVGAVIPSIGAGEMVTVNATTCIFEDTLNVATATGVQAGTACASNEATETVDVVSCAAGDSDSDSGIDTNLSGDSDDSDADSGAQDCDRDERRSCYGEHKHDTDSDSHIDWNLNGDSDDSDADSGVADCDGDDLDGDPAKAIWRSKWKSK